MTKIFESEFRVPADMTPLLEDGGEHVYCNLSDLVDQESVTDGHMFAVLRSFHEGATKDSTDSHPAFRSLLGRRVRITVEVIED